MLKLLRANAGRLRSDKAFWVVMCGTVVYALFICFVAFYQKYISGSGFLITFDELFMYAYGLGGSVNITIPAILLGIFSSLFIGTEFSDGTIRNKIVVGRTRVELYLSHFLTCAAMGILINLSYFILVSVICIPVLGPLTLPADVLVPWLAAGTLSILSYAALFTLLSMLVQNKTAVSITTLLTLFTAIFLVMLLIMRLGEPEYIEVYEMVDNAEGVMKTIPNPLFLTPGPRAVVEFIIDLFPTGQSLQLSAQTAPRPLRMALCSLGMIVAANLAGIFFFQRRDLK